MVSWLLAAAAGWESSFNEPITEERSRVTCN